MQEATDYTPRPFDIQSLDSGASTPPHHPTSLSLSASIAASLNDLTAAFDAVRLADPLNEDLKRKESILFAFQRDILDENRADDVETPIGEQRVDTVGEQGDKVDQAEGPSCCQSSAITASFDAQREETLRLFNSTLEKALLERDATLRILQHDHEETIRRLMQSHEETVRKMTQDREESNRRMVQDIASMVRQERTQ